VLTRFGLAMWLLMVPAAIALGLDDRELRGVAIWAKPLKFLASVGLFALSTAWFFGLLPEAARRKPAARAVVWTIVAMGGLEIAYIGLQAALGQPSHYHVADPLHAALYGLMGAGALLLTTTQPLLAWQIARDGVPGLDPVWRRAVLLGLTLTFVLGAGAGMVLGGMQPPAGIGLPVAGWHLAGDLRPAHFVGIHAQQALPLAGAWLAAWVAATARRGLGTGAADRASRQALRAVAALATAWSLLWVALMALGLAGR
jgi:hypothetical protein